MAMYTKRIQAVLTEEQYAELVRLSQSTKKPISLLVREAVEKVYFEREAHRRRQAALNHLLSLQAPVDEWEKMEAEIANGATK